MTNLRDNMINDLRVIANETVTNSALYFAIAMTGVDSMIYKNNDPTWLIALKSGALSSVVNVAGANIRNMYPMLNFFS